MHGLNAAIARNKGLQHIQLGEGKLMDKTHPGTDHDVGNAGSDLTLFRKAFPQGTIEVMQPGVYRVDTGPRVFRPAQKGVIKRTAGLHQLCKQELRHADLEKQLREQAALHGAEILEFSVHRKLIHVHYRSRTEFIRYDPINRVGATSWGQLNYRKGQSLAVLTIQALFPASDWTQNTRPDFLKYKNGRKLELDGYSKSLKLAIEYHGPHHYQAITQQPEHQNEFMRQVERDQIKRKLCEQNGVRLVEVRHEELDPKTFLEKIRSIVIDMGLTPTQPDPDLKNIHSAWEKVCQNPLGKFQNGVMQALGQHALITPKKEYLTPTTILTYRCSVCDTVQQAQAKGLLQAGIRTHCPACKGERTGLSRRKRTYEAWHQAGLPASFLKRLGFQDGNHVHVCDHGHDQVIHSPTFATRHIQDGKFRCLSCVENESGLNYRHAASLPMYQQTLKDQAQELGLTVLEFRPYKDKDAVANVRCPEGHTFDLTRQRAANLLKGSVLKDRSVVPSACPTCCYPGIDTSAYYALDATVHHRLQVLQGLYPHIQYLKGFDPTGWDEEHFSCGRSYSDGMPHPSFHISYRNLQKAAKHSASHHLCIACGFEDGQMIGRNKTLNDVQALVKAMRDSIGKLGIFPSPLHEPSVTRVNGPLSEEGYINSTKTKLRIWCGVPGHKPIEATKDYYFNRAENRGRGYCPDCVDLSGRKKAPIPQEGAETGQLNLVIVRQSTGDHGV